MKRIVILFVLWMLGYNLNAQDILIPYRKGTLWGLSDTNANIVVEPQFQRIEYNSTNNFIPFGSFTIKKDGKYGIIVQNKVVIDPTHYVVFNSYEFFRTLNKIKGIKTEDLYSSDGQLQVKNISRGSIHYLKIYLNGVEDKHTANLYCYSKILNGEKLKNLFVTDGRGKIVKILLQNKKSIDRMQHMKNMIVVKDTFNHKSIYQVKKMGDEIVLRDITPEKRRAEQAPQFEDIDQVVIKDENENSIPMPMPISESKRSRNGKQEKWIEYRSFSITGTEIFLHGKKGPSKGKQEIVSILKKCKGCKIIDYIHVGKYGTKYDTDSTKVFERNFVLTRKRNKVGVITSRLKLKEDYNWVVPYGNRYGHPAMFVLGQINRKGTIKKSGVINDLGEWLVPITNLYDSLYFVEGQNRFITLKNNKYGLLLDSGEELLPPIYDKIKKSEYGSYAMKQNGKWGLLKMKTFLIQPVFDDVPKYKRTFYKKYKTYKMIDENSTDKFLGYANLRGVKYYEE